MWIERVKTVGHSQHGIIKLRGKRARRQRRRSKEDFKTSIGLSCPICKDKKIEIRFITVYDFFTLVYAK
jgi:hypothetical protein